MKRIFLTAIISTLFSMLFAQDLYVYNVIGQAEKRENGNWVSLQKRNQLKMDDVVRVADNSALSIIDRKAEKIYSIPQTNSSKKAFHNLPFCMIYTSYVSRFPILQNQRVVSFSQSAVHLFFILYQQSSYIRTVLLIWLIPSPGDQQSPDEKHDPHHDKGDQNTDDKDIFIRFFVCAARNGKQCDHGSVMRKFVQAPGCDRSKPVQKIRTDPKRSGHFQIPVCKCFQRDRQPA